MKRIIMVLMLAVAPAAAGEVARTVPPPVTAPANQEDSARQILARYVAAWRGTEEMTLAEPLVVGFRFTGKGGGEHHVVVLPDGTATLRDGVPPGTVAFTGNIEMLRRLDRGELSAMTALGRASWSDRTPLDVELPEGFLFTAERQAVLLPFVFHFWNREWPEVVRFGEGTTRLVHGGNAAIFYYDRELRSGFYQVEPGQHINREADQQTNPFPSLFIMIRGQVEARLGGIERRLHEGEAVLVPPGMTHEFWAGPEQYGEFIMVAFGDGA